VHAISFLHSVILGSCDSRSICGQNGIVFEAKAVCLCDNHNSRAFIVYQNEKEMSDPLPALTEGPPIRMQRMALRKSMHLT